MSVCSIIHPKSRDNRKMTIRNWTCTVKQRFCVRKLQKTLNYYKSSRFCLLERNSNNFNQFFAKNLISQASPSKNIYSTSIKYSVKPPVFPNFLNQNPQSSSNTHNSCNSLTTSTNINININIRSGKLRFPRSISIPVLELVFGCCNVVAVLRKNKKDLQ